MNENDFIRSANNLTFHDFESFTRDTIAIDEKLFELVVKKLIYNRVKGIIDGLLIGKSITEDTLMRKVIDSYIIERNLEKKCRECGIVVPEGKINHLKTLLFILTLILPFILILSLFFFNNDIFIVLHLFIFNKLFIGTIFIVISGLIIVLFPKIFIINDYPKDMSYRSFIESVVTKNLFFFKFNNYEKVYEFINEEGNSGRFHG